MGTITARRRKDGSTGYTAQIRIKRDGKIVHTESETFGKKALAVEWLRRREAVLDTRRARGDSLGKQQTVAELIDWYIKEVGPHANWGRTKAYDLKRIKRYAIAQKPCDQLTVQDYLDHANTRREEGAGPATVGNDFVWLGQVFRSARVSLRAVVSNELLDDARHELRKRKVIAKSKRRDRRVSADEERALIEHFEQRAGRGHIPMADIVRFALLTARREEEITRLRWRDLDENNGIAWLDDVKHPTQKRGNRRAFRMLSDAWAIVNRQPRAKDDDAVVFPYNPKSIGSAFARARSLLGINGVTFHTLRHEATSRLFERGYAIQDVAQFTLHDSWETLKRYTHLRPESVPERPAK
ncbi:MAG TPA: site-specific integrase [Tahibacter sp.]|nr:site-specific integrase [Tahibacter sp.]